MTRLERARKEGKKLGRPKLSGTIREKVVKLRKEGKSYREIRRKLMLK